MSHRTAARRALAWVAGLVVGVTIATATAPGPAAAGPASLRRGDRGPDVRWVQARLADLGLFRSQPTGTFGAQTEAAVRAYQARVRLEASGVVGPRTAARLLGEQWEVTVRRGQTMTAIAAARGLTAAQLALANPQIIDADHLQAGRRLVIPGTPRLVALAGGPGRSAPAPPAPPAHPAAVPVAAPARPAATAGRGPGPANPPASVFLTLDGPLVPAIATRIIEILGREAVPAALFVTGADALASPQVVREAVRLGLSIQSAGWDHGGAGAPGGDPRRLAQQLDSAAGAIAGLTGVRPRWWRPAGPPGAGAGDYPIAAQQAGQAILWWHNIGALPDGPATVARLDRHLIDGAVIRLPAGEVTLTYLETWLERCRALGVRFRPLGELTGAPRGF